MRAFHFLQTDYALQAIQDHEIKVSRFDDLNDPFELYGADLRDRTHRKKFGEFKQWVSEQFGLLCLSRRWRNPLLWSHYGDRHRGVALEFEIDDDSVAEVRYAPYRLKLETKEKLNSTGFSEEDAYSIAVTKSAHWKYEEEVRIFIPLSKCTPRADLFFEPLGLRVQIVGIVLGPLCDLSVQQLENTIPRGRSLSMTKSRLAFKSFNVVTNRALKTRMIHGVG